MMFATGSLFRFRFLMHQHAHKKKQEILIADKKIRHKRCAFVSTGLSRVAEATLAKPTLQGALLSWYCLVAVGLSAATLSSLTRTKSFLRLPAGKDGTSAGSRCQGPISSAPNQHLSSIRFLKRCADACFFRRMLRRPFGDASCTPVQQLFPLSNGLEF